ncbi:hypothetical protein [Actinomadura livida]|uniref:DUF559 domain-containing protein n=1 Tax=Actinomadura livida TaxID=79909 RepID=A0A7W7MVP8_9ACTN|nr:MULTISPECIES: hypothetical protein [Actinomadura]MBB4772085.1 hypothetical protein [Actinomadura catellatispora]GGU39529.1 hypothetical protein GCM10010208_74700 [Actinomadura livida]
MFYDVYASASLDDSVHVRCDAAALILPADSVFCGVTAARLYGVPVPDGDLRVHAAVPATASTVPRVKQLRVHSYSIPAGQVSRLDGRRVIGPERLYLELAASVPRIDLVIAGDHMLRRQVSTREQLHAFLKTCYRRRGVRKAKLALQHLEPRSDSPPETRLRMLIVDAGLPRPIANQDVFNDWGVWLARPDLSYPAVKIAIEYEGLHHQQDPRQYSRDIERDGGLIDEGWVVIRVNKDGLFRTPRQVVNRVRKALDARRPSR